MIWDPCLARAVAGELDEALGGSRAVAVSFRRADQVARVHFRERTLDADLSPGRGDLRLGPATEPDADATRLPAVLVSARALPDERVIVLRFRRVRGRAGDRSLVLELATNRWNALLAEGPERVVRVRLRAIKGKGGTPPVGRPWTPPGRNRGPRAGADGTMEPEAWEAAVGRGSRDERRRRLLSKVAYASPLNAAWLLDAREPGEEFRRWTRLANGADAAPHLLALPTGLQPYPWPLSSPGAVPMGSLLSAMEAAATGGLDAARPTAEATAGAGWATTASAGRATMPGPASRGPIQDAAALSLARETARLRRRIDRLRSQQDRTAQADRLREDAALLLSSLHRVPLGASQVALIGFDGQERTLELNPAARPQDHANALFRRAARMERGAATVAARIEAAEDALAMLNVATRRQARGELSAEELAVLLPSARPSGRQAANPTAAPVLPYRRYRSSGGLEIRVGRGARRNDDLTFHHSRPDDVWLHARHAAGAHAVLRWTRAERPPAADLEEAAVLAANHSLARGSQHVPVDWTRRKWVRKPRGAPPGAVVPDRVQTVFVSPDPSLEVKLAWRHN